MAQTKISQLTELSSIADNDVLAGVDTSAGTTKKVKMSTLKSYINTGDAQDVQINGTSVVSGNVANIAVQGTYNASTNKIASMSEIPTKTSELTNDSNFEVNTNKITTIDENSTDTQYPSAKATYDLNSTTKEDLENELAETQAQLDTYKTIFNALPKVSGTGESISLDGTAESPLKMDLYGNTYQETTTISGGDEYDSPSPDHPQDIHVVSGDNEVEVCGKNLWGLSKAKIGSNYHNTYVEDGETISVTATSTFAYRSYYIEGLVVGNTYTISFDGVKDENATYGHVQLGVSTTTQSDYGFKLMTTTKTNYSLTFVATDSVFHIALYPVNTSYTSGGTITLSNIQLELGSEKTTFEPYQGKDYTINLGVENLSPQSVAITTSSGNLNYSTGGTFGYVENGKTYTLSLIISSDNTTTGNTEIRCYTSQTSGTNQGVVANFNRLNGGGKIVRTFTSSYTGYLAFSGSNMLSDNKVFTNIQLEEGDTAHSYTPYGADLYELCKIGTYQDYLYKDNGKWYKYGMIDKVVLNGSESWLVSNNVFYITSIVNYAQVKQKICYANYYNGIVNTTSGTSAITTNNTVCFYGVSGENHRFYVRDERYTSRDDFKSWLSTHNTIVYYVLATPTITEITNPILIQQLNDLQNALSYQNQTNISQSNNDLPFIIDAQTLLDISNLENRVTLLED